MKYLVPVLAASLLSITLSLDAHGQIFDRLKKKAKEAATQKAEEKLSQKIEEMTYKMVEDSWNSIFGEMGTDSLSPNSTPFMMSSNVQTEDAYDFNIITTMEVITTSKDGKSEPPMFMDMYFNQNKSYTGAKFRSEEMQKQDGDLFIVYDFDNKAMLMLISNKKDNFSFAYDWNQLTTQAEESTDDNEQETNQNTDSHWKNYTHIGSKTILGYQCDGYQSENDNEIVELWIAPDADFGSQRMFGAHANAKQIKGKIPEDYPTGMMMEMQSENRNSGEKISLKVTSINRNSNVTYSMADFPTFTFNSNPQKTNE